MELHNQKKYHFRLKHIRLIAIFLLLSIIMTCPLWLPHQMLVQSDWSFHASRVEELYNNLKSNHWNTYIATRTFSGTGVGSFLFYPTLFLYPWALLKFIFSPLTSFYIWLSAILFAGFIINYFCMYRFSNNKLQSFLFALAYNLFPYHVFLGTANFTLGEFIGTIFIPIAFLGLYNLLFNKSNWLYLSIGMTLIIYSHILTTLMTVEFLALLFALYLIIYKGIDLPTLYKLLKSVILCILLILPIIIPFITDYIGKNMQSAYTVINPSLLKSASDILIESANNYNGVNIGLLLLISIFGYNLLNKEDKLYKLCLFMGVTAFFISTTVFPWMLVRNLPISAIQLPYRYLSYSAFFLSVYFSKVVLNIATHYPKFSTNWFAFLVTILFLTCYFGSLTKTIGGNMTGNNIPPITETTKKNMVIPNPTRLNNNNYTNQFSYTVKFGETDYFPRKSLKYSDNIINNISLVNGKQKIYPKITAANKIIYKVKLKKAALVDFPVVCYAHTTLNINNKQQKILNSHRGTVSAHLNAGENKVTIGYQPSILYYISLLISLSVFILLIISRFYKINKHQ